MSTWAGIGLSAGVDTYLRTRAELSREDEMDQIAQLRKQQSQAIQQQLQDREDLAEGARRLAAPDASVSDVTLAQGVPPTLPASDTVMGDQQQPSPNQSAGGVAPDASLGNQAQTTTATPGAPGMAPVTKRFRTEADAMKTLGPELYGRLASSQQGRAMLTSQGITPDAEIARQQKQATAMQEVRVLLGKSEQAAKEGRAGDATYLQAAAMERIAEIQDNPTMQAHYMERATTLRGLAQADAADPRANDDYRNIWEAYTDLKQDPSNPEKLLAFQSAATSAKTKLGQAFGQKALDAWGTAHSNDQFNTELMGAMQKTGGDVPRALSLMMKNPSPAFMAALPKLLESKTPGIQKVFGLEDEDKLLGNGLEGRLALMQTKAQGADTSTPQGMQRLVDNYRAIVKSINEVKRKDPENVNQLVGVLKPYVLQAQKDYERAQEELTKAQTQGPKARAQAEAHLNETREALNDLTDQINQVTGLKMKHFGELARLDVNPTVVPKADPKVIKNRTAELVAEEVRALGHRPNEAEKVAISQRVQKRLQGEGLIATTPQG